MDAFLNPLLMVTSVVAIGICIFQGIALSNAKNRILERDEEIQMLRERDDRRCKDAMRANAARRDVDTARPALPSPVYQ